MAIDRTAAASPGFRAITESLRDTGPSSPGVGKTDGPSFSDALANAVGQVEGSLTGATDAVQALASGENVDLHGTMIALEKADIALRMTVTARDKFIGAYEQIMNMSL